MPGGPYPASAPPPPCFARGLPTVPISRQAVAVAISAFCERRSDSIGGAKDVYMSEAAARQAQLARRNDEKADRQEARGDPQAWSFR